MSASGGAPSPRPSPRGGEGGSAFPGFDVPDFGAFAKEKQRDPAANAERLAVKRKLAALGDIVGGALGSEASLELEMRTSLSHPYTYNAYRVASMWVYFSRREAEKRALRRILGAELGKDLDPSYIHAILLVEIDAEGLVAALKVHPAAWWDGQNLKNRCTRGGARAEAAAVELARLLNGLPPGFAMTMGDWKRRYEAGKVRPLDVDNFFRYFTPGEMWLHVTHPIAKADVLARSRADAPALARDLARLLVALAPLYRFIAWSPANDHVLQHRDRPE